MSRHGFIFYYNLGSHFGTVTSGCAKAGRVQANNIALWAQTGPIRGQYYAGGGSDRSKQAAGLWRGGENQIGPIRRQDCGEGAIRLVQSGGRIVKSGRSDWSNQAAGLWRGGDQIGPIRRQDCGEGEGGRSDWSNQAAGLWRGGDQISPIRRQDCGEGAIRLVQSGGRIVERG